MRGSLIIAKSVRYVQRQFWERSSHFTLDRIIEADWSAEFEYPDVHISSAKQALLLCEDGRVLLKYLEDEQTN
jgi:hypothetical protein